MLKSGAFNRKKHAGLNADSWTHYECPPLPHIEYNIYSYSNENSPRACWKKCGCASHPDSAMSHAETLFNSGRYRKIEVKQKYFDPHRQRNIDETWRVFEKGVIRNRSPGWIIGFALAAAIAALAITYA